MQVLLRRRRLLSRSWTAGLGLLALACAPSLPGRAAEPTRAAAAKPAAALPTYVPLQPVSPDLPADVDGLEAGYLTYPKDPPSSVAGVPGTGGDVDVLVWNPGPALTSPDQNALWAALNARTG